MGSEPQRAQRTPMTCSGFFALIAGRFFRSSCCGEDTTIPIPLDTADPFPTHLLRTRRQRTESAKKELCFMSGATATLSTIVHRKSFCCISEQQCSLKISCLRGLHTFFQLRSCLRQLSSTLPEQSNSEDVSLSMSGRACQDIGVVIFD